MKLKHLLLLLLLVASQFISIIAINPATVSAANFSGELSGIREPAVTTSEEVGIWADRALIYLYHSSNSTPGEVTGVKHALWAEVTGLNDGNIKYSNGCQELTVNFSGYNDTPASGTLTDCDGKLASTVRLVNQKNAFLDGYSYSTSNEELIFMPRYISGVENCGGVPVSGKYSSDGTFKKDGSEYKLNSDSRTVINNYQDGSPNATAKQKRTSEYKVAGVGQSCTLSYAGDGQDGGRTIYLLKGYNREEVKSAITDKIDEYQSKRGRKERLTDYFAASTAGQTALRDCQTGAQISGSQADMINLLVEVGDNAGSNPFVDCMLRELADDSEFRQALDYSYSGNFEENLNLGEENSCNGGGIPIISDLVCSITRWLFDIIFDAFTGIIGWLAQPPDMFEQQNSTLEASMRNLRNIANIIFIIAFLALIFQYLTNVNVADAYFIKKFVPRLVIAVVLVQASFWITAELNYFFYDLGRSVQSIVFFGQQPGGLQISNGVATLALFAGPALLGMAMIIGLIMLIVLVITVVVLAIRYVLIIVLAIFAPLAFAAFAIPQLEGMTKKWLKMYIQLLMMYPIIMFFIAASSIVGGVFNGGGFVMQMMALIVQILPFIILPFTFKFAGGIMGNISGKLVNKASGFAKGKSKEAYGNSQFGMRRAKEKEMKKGIKSDRAGNAASERMLEKMRGVGTGKDALSRYKRARMYGVGVESGEMDKYRGVFEEKEKKRKQEEAQLALSSRLAQTNNRDEAVGLLRDEYRTAMQRGDVYAANAAYAGLVGQKDTKGLTQIQEDANDGVYNTASFNGTSAYNQQQGSNYGDLAFAPHLRGDVGVDPTTGAKKNLAIERAKNLRNMSNDQLAEIKPEAWDAWRTINPTEAATRFASILESGGSPAARLSPESRDKLLADPAVVNAINETDDSIRLRATSLEEQREATLQRDLLKKHLG